MSRIESPSSINMFKQCPRKYFFRYIKKLPTSKSIYLTRGSIAHYTLEDFFDIDENITGEDSLRIHLFHIFEKKWDEAKEELDGLKLGDAKIKEFHDETYTIFQNWFGRFKEKLKNAINTGLSFDDAFKRLTPIREMEYKSEEHKVRGFIDVIYELDGKVFIIDYKTGKKTDISPEYYLQLGIYAFMYKEVRGVVPDFVGIDFLGHTERIVPVTEQLMEDAKKNVDYVHSRTVSIDMNDYPKKTSPLCKWRSGQCDFYEQCFQNFD